MKNSNENKLGIYRIGYDIGPNHWTANIIAYGPDNASKFIARTIGKPIKVTERTFVSDIHHITKKTHKVFFNILKKESPELFKSVTAEATSITWGCPYCDWTGKTQNALKAHITREHK